MNEYAQQLIGIGEDFAAAFIEEPEASVQKKFCHAYKRWYENCPLSYVEGSPLFPSGRIQRGDRKVSYWYCMQYAVDVDGLREKCEKANIPGAFEKFMEFHRKCGWGYAWDGGWNHSTLNYRRILKDGLNRYEERVRAMKNEELRDDLLEVLEGIRIYHRRSLDYLKESGADSRLIEALEKVPYEPAQTAYEALVSANFVMYLDSCDNIGRVDSWLYPYWKGEDLTEVMHRMLRNVQDNDNWSITLGPDYNELTFQWLKASAGLARPMVELRTVKDMPKELWEAAIENVLTGAGQPAFYNEEAIQRRLAERIPHAPREDLMEFGGVGCTETCFSGLTYSGGIDMNLNVLKILEEHMKELAAYGSFEDFYSAFTQKLRAGQDEIVRKLNLMYRNRAQWSFSPIRTLFIDDCIDNEKGYLQGGARYTFAIPSESGIPNTVDSLLAIRTLVYDRKAYTPEEFLKALEDQDPLLKARIRQCPCYGIGDPEADSLLRELTEGFYAYYAQAKTDMGLGVFPTSHQFLRHIEEGAAVGATPDGRCSGHPVADSIAAVNGKAVKGPTKMLLSAVSYAQEQIYGIPVLNLSITRKYDPKVLRALIEGYFEMGGTQIQITCTTKETLLEAKKDPDSHKDLIVRVGGYSEYFRNLSEELKDAVIERTMFGEDA